MSSAFDSYLTQTGYLLVTGTPNAADNGQTMTGATRTAIACRFQPNTQLVRQRDGSWEQAAAIVYLPSGTTVTALNQFEFAGTVYGLLDTDGSLGPAGNSNIVEITVG